MFARTGFAAAIVVLVGAVAPLGVQAQTMTMPMPQSPSPPTTSPAKPQNDGMVSDDALEISSGFMAGALGTYSMMRDASGTSWQPDSTPMRGIMDPHAFGDWGVMLDGISPASSTIRRAPAGATKPFSESMLMGMAQNQLGPGTLTLRSMFSLDPFMGKSGYPLPSANG